MLLTRDKSFHLSALDVMATPEVSTILANPFSQGGATFAFLADVNASALVTTEGEVFEYVAVGGEPWAAALNARTMPARTVVEAALRHVIGSLYRMHSRTDDGIPAVGVFADGKGGISIDPVVLITHRIGADVKPALDRGLALGLARLEDSVYVSQWGDCVSCSMIDGI